MTLTLSGDGISVDLINAQEDGVNNEVSLIETSLFARDTDETFLLPLGVADANETDGRATGHRLAASSGYSNDPETALAQFCSRIESFVDGTQSGYELSSTHRNRTVGGMLRNVYWERAAGAPLEVTYHIEFVRGRDFHISFGGSSDPEGVSPSGSASLGGYDLGELLSYKVTREQKLSSTEIPQFSDSVDIDDNLVYATGGPRRQINIEGRKTGSQSELTSFENGVRDLAGDIMNTVSFSEAFPGRNLDVAIGQFQSDYEAGTPRVLNYRLEMVEGIQIQDVIDAFSDFYDDITS